MKIFETVHNKVHYWLVFDGLEIVGKFESYKDASNFIHTTQGAK